MPTYFVIKDEFITTIPTNTLNYLTGGDDTIIDEMVDEAVEEISAYLVRRYNIAGIFSVTGADRSKIIMMLIKDIVIYNLHSRHQNRIIPEIRVKRYQQAMQWLKDVCDKKIDPTKFTPLATPIVRSGGNEKRENHQE